MRIRLCAALVTACVLALSFAGVASASSTAPVRPEAKFLTSAVQQKLQANGAMGVRVGDEALNTECPGVQNPGVSAGGCIVAPRAARPPRRPGTPTAPRGTARAPRA